MKRLTTFLLIASLLVPGVALGGVCCHASVWAESAAWTQAACCCPAEAGCGLSAEACEPAALHEQGMVPSRLSDGSSTGLSHGVLAGWSSLTIRSWWARKVRMASADPPTSPHPIVSLPLRL